MNRYLEIKNRHQNEFEAMPIQWAFSKSQFAEGMTALGLDPAADTDKIVTIGHGGFIRKTDGDLLIDTIQRHNDEMAAAIEQDTTGEGFILEMFDYELSNHEFIVTGSFESTIEALGISRKDLAERPALLHGLNLAIKAQYKYHYPEENAA